MKYKCLLVCMFMLASIVATCQEKFIEVTVTDTLTIKANKFVYTIMANPWFDVDDDTTGSMSIEVLQQRFAAQAKQRKLMADSFKNVLLHKSFRMLPGNEKSKFTPAAENKPYFINILTSSLDSVHIIYNLIKGNPGFIAFITLRTSTSEDACKQELRKHIIDKAKDEALGIAAQKGVTLGNILSIKEAQKRDKNRGWTAYPPLSAWAPSDTPGWHTTILPAGNGGIPLDSDNYIIESTLVVRFKIR